jgi:hypothetical protein
VLAVLRPGRTLPGGRGLRKGWLRSAAGSFCLASRRTITPCRRTTRYHLRKGLQMLTTRAWAWLGCGSLRVQSDDDAEPRQLTPALVCIAWWNLGGRSTHNINQFSLPHHGPAIAGYPHRSGTGSVSGRSRHSAVASLRYSPSGYPPRPRPHRPSRCCCCCYRTVS